MLFEQLCLYYLEGYFVTEKQSFDVKVNSIRDLIVNLQFP